MAATIAELKKELNWNHELLSTCADSTVAQAAQIMSKNGIGCLIVFDANNQFVGILSERDMLKKICAGNILPGSVNVKDIMTTSIVSCSLDTPVTEAERLMAENHIRHLPILEDDHPIGMISSRDMIDYRLKHSKAMQMAAEEIAMLPAGLKSLDLKDVVAMATHEIPRSFGAQKAALYIKEQAEGQFTISQNDCQCAESTLSEYLSDSDQSHSVQMMTKQACADCKNASDSVCKFVIPLFIQGHRMDKDAKNASGVLCMCRPDNPALKADQTQLYKATILQQVLGANLTNAKLYSSYKEARHNSETDPLTGVGTRRVLENVLSTECARASRYGRTFSVGIADLDYFKQINDTAGHAAGDKTLKDLADLMQQATRDSDVVITRYGGDEFVLVLPETDAAGAQIVMERIRQRFNDLTLPGIELLSISSGVAQWSAEPADTPETIMKRADACLYEAKKRGRNCVVACSEILVSSN